MCILYIHVLYSFIKPSITVFTETLLFMFYSKFLKLSFLKTSLITLKRKIKRKKRKERKKC